MNSHHQTELLRSQKNSQQRYLNKTLSLLIWFLVIASIYLFDQRPEFVSWENAFLGLGIIWVSLYPSFQYLYDQNRPPMPFFPLVGLFYATSFGWPIFFDEVNDKSFSFYSLKIVDTNSLALVLLGLISMNLVFYFSKSFLWKQIVPLQLSNNFRLKSLLFLLWSFLILHFANNLSTFTKAIPSIGQLAEPIGFISFGMFFVLWKQNLLSEIQKYIILFICIPMELIPKLASGSLAPVMMLGFFMMIITFYETKRLPIVLIATTLSFLLILNPIKGEFRQLTWKGGARDLNPIEKVQLFIDLAIDQYTKPFNSKNSVNVKESTLTRTAHIMLFAAVVRDTPSKVPYWEGESYASLLTAFIPRFILPDKPNQTIGNTFGRRYSYLHSTDLYTSLNLPWIVEMYANFGTMGVLLGMSIIGGLLGFLDQKLNRPEMHSLEFVTGAAILFGLIYQESNFSLMFGGVLWLYISLSIIFKIVLGGSRRYLPKN